MLRALAAGGANVLRIRNNNNLVVVKATITSSLQASTINTTNVSTFGYKKFSSSSTSSSSPPQLERTYGGPYTEQQIQDLEKFAMDVYRSHEPSKKLVDPWLRAKLGPYYAPGWQQRVGARENLAAKKEREAQRPAESSHFTVSHPAPEATLNQEDSKSLFAIIGLAGTQYKVTTGDVVICNRLPGAEVGTKIELTDVLLVASPSETFVGRPNVPNWVVTAFVEQQAREKKQLAFYKKQKTFSQKVRGFRREVTILRIADIQQKSDVAAASPTGDSKAL